MNNKKAFTLIELIITAAILCIISLTIVSAFSGGLKIYYRMRDYSTVKADVLLAMEKMERDIANTFAYTGIDFIGAPAKAAFPALVRSYGADKKPYMSVGSVSYYIDEGSKQKKLVREERDYPASSAAEGGSKGRIAALAAMESVRFKYYYYDSLSAAYGWTDSWDKTEDREKDKEERKPTASLKDRREYIPMAVKVTVVYGDGGKEFTLNRAIFIEPAVSLRMAKIAEQEKLEKEAKE